MQAKIAALLGFASKAKKLVSGETAVDAMLKKGQARLVILAEDGSKNLAQRYTNWCSDEGVPVVTLGTKHTLGLALGRSPRSVIAVTDEHFAQSILQTGGFVEKN